MVPLDVNEDVILAWRANSYIGIRGTVQINPGQLRPIIKNNVTSTKSSKCNFTCLGYTQDCPNGIIDITSEDEVVVDTTLSQICFQCLNTDGTTSAVTRFELGGVRFDVGDGVVMDGGVSLGQIVNSVLEVFNPATSIPPGRTGARLDCLSPTTNFFGVSMFSSGKKNKDSIYD